MKIAWFTPYERRSAIGRFSASVVRELARVAHIDLWHPTAREPLPCVGRRRVFRTSAEISDATLEAYDLVVYNMGNFLPYHGEIYDILRRVPGLCILHDLVLQDFFLAYFIERKRDPSGYVAAMARHYGQAGQELARVVLAGEAREILGSEKVLRFPLFEEAIQKAYGVVTHSRWALRRVQEGFAGPVEALLLPYEGPAMAQHNGNAEVDTPAGRVVLVTAGAINRNRRVDAVLRVLAEHRDLRKQVFYVVVGPIEEQYRLTLVRLIERHHLSDAVRLCGYLEDDVFAAYLRKADVCVNLRWPATEAGSASLVEQMYSAKPVIVSDVGLYSELPSDCLWRISPHRETEELAIALANLVECAELRKELGQKARRFAEENFSASTYARRLLDFAWEVRSWKPLCEVADRVGRELSTLQMQAPAEVLDLVSAAVCELFGEPETAEG